MIEKAAAERTQAEIPYAVLEYTAVFKKPIIEAWRSPGALTAAILDALEPQGFSLDGVEVKTQTEKLNEHEIIFRRTTPVTPGLSFALGFGKVTVTAENLEWTEADQFVAGLKTALEAILRTGRAEIGSQLVGLGMHIQLKTRPRKDVTAQLLDPAAFKMLDGEVRSSGIILMREKSSIVIDASVAYANGLFVRMLREHPPEATFEHMAEVLQNDEKQLFDVLGLEGTL